jgi:cytochrome c-type biogenesis protein CcmH|tara:strand:- start:468 stop:863 length:396 start_codon:yes stop_codon:yes gene_type:complete
MKKLFFIFTFCLVMFSQSAFSSQEREVEIYKNIRCLVCQGQSLNDSNSDFANDLKKIIKKKIDQKENDQQIYQYLVERYGDWILFDPPLKKSTLLLWLTPLLVMTICLFFLFRKTIYKTTKADSALKSKVN